MISRRAKIVCTIGPACNTPEGIDALVAAGMDVARLNFSHGTHDDHARAIATIREVSTRRQKAVAILGDLCGPKIRVGKLNFPAREVVPGERFVLVGGAEAEGDRVPVRYDTLAEDMRVGDLIHLDDGRMRMRVMEVKAPEVHVLVEEGGQLTARDA